MGSSDLCYSKSSLIRIDSLFIIFKFLVHTYTYKYGILCCGFLSNIWWPQLDWVVKKEMLIIDQRLKLLDHIGNNLSMLLSLSSSSSLCGLVNTMMMMDIDWRITYHQKFLEESKYVACWCCFCSVLSVLTISNVYDFWRSAGILHETVGSSRCFHAGSSM